MTSGGRIAGAVIEGSWKLICAPRPELYDLESDPGELANLVDNDRRRSVELRQRLTALEAGAVASAAATDDSEALAAGRSGLTPERFSFGTAP